MPELDPTDALVTCERALRQLFARAYLAAYGPNWLSTVEPDAQKLDKWERTRENERGRREPRGVLAIPEERLDYADFFELCNIAERNWGPLEPALGLQEETLPLLRRFNKLRNWVAHSRQPLGFEADLLSGIAGQIRNMVTKYMTDQDPSGDHYSRIESVTDSYGRTLAGRPGAPTGTHTGPTVRLAVGDVVTFDCVGHDPQGRELRWVARRAGSPGELVGTAEGGRVSFQWVVRADDVGQSQGIRFTVAADSRYQRHGFGTHDDDVFFWFEVVPPTAG